MPELTKSEDAFVRDAVDVAERRHRQNTAWIKLLAASALVASGFCLAVYVFLNASPQLDKFRDNAWTLVTVIVSSALGYLYGARERE